MKSLIKKLIIKIKKFFHNCKVVQEVYPNNLGNIRIVECTECGKFHLVDFNKKRMKRIHFKNYNNISIYIKTMREEQQQ